MTDIQTIRNEFNTYIIRQLQLLTSCRAVYDALKEAKVQDENAIAVAKKQHNDLVRDIKILQKAQAHLNIKTTEECVNDFLKSTKISKNEPQAH